jgi:hypothetical protein
MGKERDHIDNKIADSFNSQERKAPTGLWSGISASVDLTSDEVAIKDSFTKTQTKQAPKKGWSTVKKQLIIDEVWSNILAFQEKRRRRAIIWWWSGSLATLILLVGVTWNYVNSSNTQVESKHPRLTASSLEYSKENESRDDPSTNNEQHNEEATNGIGLISYINESLSASLSTHLVNATNSNINGNSKVIAVIPNDSKRSDGDLPNHIESVVEPQGIDNLIDGLMILPIRPMDRKYESELAELTILDLTPFKKFEIGLNLSGGNTWLFNNDVKNGFSSNSLIHNKLTTGYSIGLEGFYNLNPRHSLFVEYDVYSVHQQNYSFYNSGRLIDKSITLKQQKAILGYKFSFMDRAYNKRNFVIRAGAFFAHSIKEQTQVNYLGNTSNSDFETVDYGINVAGGIEHKFHRFKLEYGLRSDIGIHNLTASSVNLPKKFDYATSFMFGGYISFRYKL